MIVILSFSEIDLDGSRTQLSYKIINERYKRKVIANIVIHNSCMRDSYIDV